jgi:hypothetical protein
MKAHMDKLIRNAIDSIEVGVQDSLMGDPRRDLSAVRNIYAGVLLLCKAVLWKHSPDAEGSLIFLRFDPVVEAGKVKWELDKSKTVDVNEIKERFKLLGLKLDWAKLSAIRKHRNDIEHLYATATAATVKASLASALPLITSIMTDLLDMPPEHEFQDDIWAELLQNAEIQAKIEEECEATFANIKWESEVPFPNRSFECRTCGSRLIHQLDPDVKRACAMELSCRACKSDQDLAEVMEAALAEEASVLNYIAMTEGGAPPLAQCPDCGYETFVRDMGECVLCEISLGSCAVCYNAITPEDYSPDHPGLCSYHAQQLMKDD